MTARKAKSASSQFARKSPSGTSPRSTFAGWLRLAALAVVLLVGCVRVLMAEDLGPGWMALVQAPGGPTAAASMALAGCILLAGVLWLVSQLLAPRPVVGWAGLLLVGLFAAGGAVSFAAASNKAAARNHAAQSIGLLLTFWLLLQLLDSRRLRQLALLAVLTTGTLFVLNGLQQHYYENPRFIAQDWPREREQFFAAQGWQPDDPAARQFEERVRSAEVKSFALNANMAAAGVIPLMLGLLGWAMQKWSGPKAPLRRVCGGLTGVLFALTLWVLLLTGSRGGILAGVLALVMLAGLSAARGWLARHWKAAAAASAALVLLLAVGVMVFCAAMDQPAPDSFWYRSGPAQSLLVRWQYWTGGWRAHREHPLTGVGGGNFRSAYLRHKLPQALEDVADPHNFALAALVEYGPLGAAGLLGLLGWTFWRLIRPRPEELDALRASTPKPRDDNPWAFPSNRRLLLGAMLFPLLLAAVRAFIQWPDYAELLNNVLIAMLGPVIALLLIVWRDRLTWPGALGEDRIRLAIGCGLAGFILACMIDFGLFQPGPATMFWALVSVALAGKLRDGQMSTPESRPEARRWPWAIALATSLLAVSFFFALCVMPVRSAEKQVNALIQAGEPVTEGHYEHLPAEVPGFFSKGQYPSPAEELSGRAAPLRRTYRQGFHVGVSDEDDESGGLLSRIPWLSRLKRPRWQWVVLGELALRSDRLEPAIPYFMAERLLAHAGEVAKVHSARAEATDIWVDMLAEARDLYDQALQRDPGNYQYWLRCGQVRMDLAWEDAEKQGAALRFLAKAVRLNPHTVQVRREYGRALLKAGRLDRAAEQFKEAIHQDDLIRRHDPKGIFALSPSARRKLEQEYRDALAAQPAPTTSPATHPD